MQDAIFLCLGEFEVDLADYLPVNAGSFICGKAVT